MTASLPTPLGPLITMIKGFGVGQIESELKEEPKENSRARSNSGFEALSREGMEWNFWVLAILMVEVKKSPLGRVWGVEKEGFLGRGRREKGLG